jgi:hypothetical protein
MPNCYVGTDIGMSVKPPVQIFDTLSVVMSGRLTPMLPEQVNRNRHRVFQEEGQSPRQVLEPSDGPSFQLPEIQLSFLWKQFE